MTGGGVLLTVELNARARVRQNHEAVVRARRRNPRLYRRRSIYRDERIDRIGHRRGANRDAGRYPGVSSDRQLTPRSGSAHGIDIDRPARVYVIQE